MKKLTSSLIILPVLLAIQSSEAALDRISDFALLDSKGEFYQLSRYRHQKAMVIMALDGTCSETMDSLDQFESLRSKFGDQPPRYENFTQSVSGLFRIPPFARDHEASARYVFDEDVTITGLRAHMHFRGKDMKFSAEYPDGTISDLLSVPNYSYAWQPTYALEQPVNLPAGTRVHVTGAFDNSENNPANPDPSNELTFGLQSWDEMFIGYWTYHYSDSRK